MNVECRAFCSVMVTSVKEWLSGIWNHSLVFSTIVVPSEQHSTQRQVLMNFYAIVHCRAEATRVRSYSHSCINDSLACMHMYVCERRHFSGEFTQKTDRVTYRYIWSCYYKNNSFEVLPSGPPHNKWHAIIKFSFQWGSLELYRDDIMMTSTWVIITLIWL